MSHVTPRLIRRTNLPQSPCVKHSAPNAYAQASFCKNNTDLLPINQHTESGV